MLDIIFNRKRYNERKAKIKMYKELNEARIKMYKELNECLFDVAKKMDDFGDEI